MRHSWSSCSCHEACRLADDGRGDDLAVSVLQVIDTLAEQRAVIEPVCALFLQSGLKASPPRLKYCKGIAPSTSKSQAWLAHAKDRLEWPGRVL